MEYVNLRGIEHSGRFKRQIYNFEAESDKEAVTKSKQTLAELIEKRLICESSSLLRVYRTPKNLLE